MSVPAWAPSVEQVAAWIRARTRSRAGTEIGTFNEETRPTRAQVEELIAQTVDSWVGDTGGVPSSAPASIAAMATTALAVETAALVELSYFPEQVNTGRSTYEYLRVLADRKVAAVSKALVQWTEESTVAPDSGAMFGLATFPDTPPIVGLDTRW